MNNKVLSDRQNYYGKQSSQPTYFDGPKISWIGEIEFVGQIIALKLENSLIMGFIMGESKFFSKFLSGLLHRQLLWGRVWTWTPSRGNCGMDPRDWISRFN